MMNIEYADYDGENDDYDGEYSYEYDGDGDGTPSIFLWDYLAIFPNMGEGGPAFGKNSQIIP